MLNSDSDTILTWKLCLSALADRENW